MRLQVGAVDHQPPERPGLGSQACEDPVEHTQPAPAHEAVVQLLVRLIGERCVALLQPVPDDIDDPADHPPVVHARNLARQREVRRRPTQLR